MEVTHVSKLDSGNIQVVWEMTKEEYDILMENANKELEETESSEESSENYNNDSMDCVHRICWRTIQSSCQKRY